MMSVLSSNTEALVLEMCGVVLVPSRYCQVAYVKLKDDLLAASPCTTPTPQRAHNI